MAAAAPCRSRSNVNAMLKNPVMLIAIGVALYLFYQKNKSAVGTTATTPNANGQASTPADFGILGPGWD